MSVIIHKQDIDDNQPMTGDETDTEDINFKYMSAPKSAINNKSDGESFCNNLQRNLSLDVTNEDLPSSNDAIIRVDQLINESSNGVLIDSFSKKIHFQFYIQIIFSIKHSIPLNLNLPT